MKFAKLSLAAIMAMGISAFATDIKVDGDVKVFYGTDDAEYENAMHGDAEGDLFDQTNSYANAAFRIGMTAENMPADLAGRLSVTVLDTFGLEDSIVGSIWAGSTTGTQIWFDEAYLKGTILDKTTVIGGRQYLDTPMVFSEKWNIVSNSYDAAVVVDQHIEKTALVAAWVMRSNVNGAATVDTAKGWSGEGFKTYPAAFDDVDNNATNGEQFSVHGAYAFGVVTSLIPYTTAQAWYYSVDSIADAYWLQADIAPEFDTEAKFTIGGQFAGTMATDAISKALADDDATAWALKLGVEVKGLKLSGAYSSTDKGDLGFSNVAGSQSKLYTEAWWNYGYVSAPDTDAYNITAEYSWADVADFGAYYTHAEFNGNDGKNFVRGNEIVDMGGTDENVDMDEFALVVSKSFGAFDTSVAYIYTDADDQNVDNNDKSDSFNTLQVYLTYNF